jgi:hypothetical protein
MKKSQQQGHYLVKSRADKQEDTRNSQVKKFMNKVLFGKIIAYQSEIDHGKNNTRLVGSGTAVPVNTLGKRGHLK